VALYFSRLTFPLTCRVGLVSIVFPS
jgi:hypothetical protein